MPALTLPYESVGKESLLERHILLVLGTLKLHLSLHRKKDRPEQNFKPFLSVGVVLVAQF